MNTIEKWNNRFINLAFEISSWSKDPSKKVGAVIVDADNKLVSVGYNGLPSWCDDCILNDISKDEKGRMMIHAEFNAISNISKNHNFKEPFRMYLTDVPCITCSKYITSCTFDINVVYFRDKGSESFQKRYCICDSLKNLENHQIDYKQI